MKKIVKNVSFLLLVLISLTISQCSKKKEETPPSACKTCKALAAGPDQQTIQKEVCTPEEEQAFRNANPGKEITCN
jgi:hypothetical protein